MHPVSRTEPAAARWELRPVNRSKADALAAELGIPPAIASVLVARGLESPAGVAEYWSPSLETLHPFGAFREMEAAVRRIRSAVDRREQIRVYGDYDVDGISATVLLVKQLRRMQAAIDYRIPNRFTQGYGITASAVERAAGDGVRLLITVDNGSTAYKAHQVARKAGIDMIVCDHHQAGEPRPDVLAHLNPKAEAETYPFPDLCGAGIAWKLAQGLGAAEEELTQYAVLGTVADMVPLQGENRVIAAFGLERLNEAIRKGDPGLNALVSVAGLEGRTLGGGHIGFQLGPRLNAAGRMEEGAAGVELLLSREPGRARALAADLDQANQERRRIQEAVFQEAMKQAETAVAGGAIGLVLTDRSWHTGVIGIVASKIVGAWHRPTILIGVDGEGIGKGSGRSVPGFDLHAGIGRMGDLLDRFGGHPMAAGLTIQAERIPEFRRRFQEVCAETLNLEDLCSVVTCDDELDPADLDASFVEILQRGAPFGIGNPTPLFLVRSVRPVGEVRVLKERHLKFSVARNGSSPISCIGFGLADRAELVRRTGGAGIDLAVRAEINEWQGRRTPQFQVQAIREAGEEHCAV